MFVCFTVLLFVMTKTDLHKDYSSERNGFIIGVYGFYSTLSV